jgi:hypothetical protein
MASESKAVKPNSKRKKYLRWAILGVVGLVFVIVVVDIILVVNNLPPMNDIENPELDISTQIYSADGQKLGSLHNGEDRDYMAIDSMSHWIKDALLATEDVRFYKHSGIDPRSPFTIVKDMFIHFRLRGGSSISQQLARNTVYQGRNHCGLFEHDHFPWQLIRHRKRLPNAVFEVLSRFGTARGSLDDRLVERTWLLQPPSLSRARSRSPQHGPRADGEIRFHHDRGG